MRFVNEFHKIDSWGRPIYDSEGNLIPTLTKFQGIMFSGNFTGGWIWSSGGGPPPHPRAEGVAASLHVTFDNIGLLKI